MNRRKLTFSWRTKLLVLLVVFSVAPMTALAIWSIGGIESTSRATTLDGLAALARAKAEALDQFTTYRKGDVERIATLIAPHLVAIRAERAKQIQPQPEVATDELPKLKDAEALPKFEPPPETQTPPTPPEEVEPAESPRLKEILMRAKQTLGLILWDQQVFEELLIIDSSGKVIASTFGEHEGKSAAELDYYQVGRRATYVQPVFLSPITKQLTMVISTPIRNEAYEQLGVVAARLNLRGFFQLITDTTGLGRTGETVVAKMLDQHVVLMAPTRHASNAAVGKKFPIESRRSSGLKEAARGHSGIGEHYDYRREETLAAWQYVPSLEWGLMVKVDTSEALTAALAARDRMIALGLAILVLVGITSLLVSRALVTPLRALKEATDRISRGDLGVQLEIHSNDEIGELADSFERMVAAIKFFREHSRTETEEVDEAPDNKVVSV